MPNADEIKAWYNQHYAATGLGSMRPPEAYHAFLDLLKVGPGTRLLDVSCGPGFLLEAAWARGIAAYGIDLSDEAARLAHRVCPKAGVAVGAGERLAFRDQAFDYVTCLGSLEHFSDMGQGLREMSRVARPSARLCIMVPNARFLGWRLLGRRGTSQQDINEELMALDDWAALFEREGLEIERVVPDLWHGVKWRNGVGSPARWLTGPVLEAAWRLTPLRWQYQFIFLLRRRSTPPTGPRSHPS